MKIYVVLEYWKIDSGESGVYASIFSTLNNAKKYLEKLKMQYAKDYETNERDNYITYDNDEGIKVSFDNADCYEISIEEQELDFELKMEVI